jgi:hypothetical protein
MSQYWSLEDILFKINDEGLGYCVEEYFTPDTFKAYPELAELWRTAQKALADIHAFFDEQCVWLDTELEDHDEDSEGEV